MTNINLNEQSKKTFQPFIHSDNKGYSSYAQYNNTPSTQDKDTYETTSSTRKKKKKQTKLIIALESVGVIAGLGLVAFATGKSQAISRKFQQWAASGENKFANVKNKDLHKFLTLVMAGFDRVSKVITNTSPMKDYALYKALDKTEVTRNIRDSISGFFSRKNRSSVEKSLKSSRNSYNEFMAVLESAVAQSDAATKSGKIKESSPHLAIKDKKAFEELKELLAGVRQTPDFIAPHVFEAHYAEMQDDMQHLSGEMSLRRLFSKESLQGFLPEDILEQRKIAFTKKLLAQKNKISCSFSDVADFAKERMLHINTAIYSIKDPVEQKKFRQHSVLLEKKLKSYAKDSEEVESVSAEGKEAARKKVLKGVQKTISNFKADILLLPDGKVKEKLLVHIEEQEDLFKEHTSANIQQIRKLAGKAWGDGTKFDVEIKRAADRHSKDANTTMSKMIDMFDKERDITLGSGPGDVVGIALPVAGYAWELSKDDTNDKRVGTSLELGVPIVGGIGSFVYTLSEQFSGFKALSASVGIGLLLNLLGSELYKKYMTFRAEQKQSADNTNKVSG